MKEVTYNINDVYSILVNKIASLELQLATEKASKNAMVKHINELEGKLKETDKVNAE